MRLGIYLADQDRGHTSSQGIITYSIAMTNALCEQLSSADYCTILASDSIVTELDVPTRANVRVSARASTAMQRVRADQVDIARLARQERLDAVYFPKGFMPLAMPSSIASIVTIHDDIPVRYVRGVWGFDVVRPGQIYAALAILLTVRRAALVTCPSPFVAERLRSLGRHKRPLLVTPPGAPPLEARARSTNRILAVTSRSAHKRSSETVQWMEQLSARRTDLDFALVGVPSSVVETLPPPPTAGAMNAELVLSRAVVFNSGYEGFGLPPMEAWALGTPAVYPDLEPMRSNLEGIPGAFTPRSFQSFANALDEVLALDPTSVEAYQATVRSRFSWATSARSLLDEARRIVGG